MSMAMPRYEQWLGRGSSFFDCMAWALSKSGGSDVLWESMEYSVMAGGKRFRPYLLHASVSAFGGDLALAAEPSVAVELIHSFSLIHDDLPAMDNDDMRRGKPTNHKIYGEAMAILAGDALHSRAFEVLMSPSYSQRAGSQKAVKLAYELATATGAAGMAGGQALDMTLAATGEEALGRMHDLKTGALITYCTKAGAIISGQDDAVAMKLGHLIGRAFQVKDDILDATSTSEELGKTAGKDFTQGKFTYVAAFGLSGANHRLKELLDEADEISTGLPGDSGALIAAIGLLRQ